MKYDFANLKCGESFEEPLVNYHSLYAAARAYMSKHPDICLVVRRASLDTCMCWRIEPGAEPEIVMEDRTTSPVYRKSR